MRTADDIAELLYRVNEDLSHSMDEIVRVKLKKFKNELMLELARLDSSYVPVLEELPKEKPPKKERKKRMSRWVKVPGSHRNKELKNRLMAIARLYVDAMRELYSMRYKETLHLERALNDYNYCIRNFDISYQYITGSIMPILYNHKDMVDYKLSEEPDLRNARKFYVNPNYEQVKKELQGIVDEVKRQREKRVEEQRKVKTDANVRELVSESGTSVF